MPETQRRGTVAYTEVAAGYFQRRRLRRYAGVGSLWALGVGAVISGDFFGWNFGLAAGGFGGLLVATLVITVMYVGLCFSVAEMAAAMPHTGGAYSFARSAMGPWGGYVTGLEENMEYILTPAVIGELPQSLVDEVTALWDRNLQLLAEIIEEGVRDGVFLDHDPWEMANILWTLANGIIQTERSTPRRRLRRRQLDRVFDDAIELVLRGLARPTVAGS